MRELSFNPESTVFLSDGLPVAQEAKLFEAGVNWSSHRFERAFQEILPFISDIENIRLGNGDWVGRDTASHSLAVAVMARDIADRWTGLPAIIDLATTGGLAHDVGKLQVGSKRGKLLDMSYTYDPNSDDRVIMSEHPRYGYEVLAAFTDQFNQSQPVENRLNLLPEQVVALLHHHAKRQTETNCGLKLSEYEHLLIDVLQFVDPNLKPDNVKKTILAVTIADVYHAIQTRHYVPADHTLRPADKASVLRWMTDNIDATRLGLTDNDTLEAAKALISVIQEQEGLIIPHSPWDYTELNGFRTPKHKKIGKRILNMVSLHQ